METDNVGAPFGLTSNQSSVTKKVSRATWAGLAISLFAMVAIRQVFVFFVPETTFASALLKEALIWLNAVALIVIIRRGEHLPLRSIGLGTAPWWKSILWGFIIAIVSAVAIGRAGLCHRLRTWSRLCRVRETAVMVDHRDRFPRRSGGRIILSRLRDRTLADDWSRPVLVGGDSAGDFFTWPLVGWRGQHSHRIRSRFNPDRILFMASRSGGQHDRSRPGGFRC